MNLEQCQIKLNFISNVNLNSDKIKNLTVLEQLNFVGKIKEFNGKFNNNISIILTKLTKFQIIILKLNN